MSIPDSQSLSITMSVAEWTVLVGFLRKAGKVVPACTAWANHIEKLAAEQDR